MFGEKVDEQFKDSVPPVIRIPDLYQRYHRMSGPKPIEPWDQQAYNDLVHAVLWHAAPILGKDEEEPLYVIRTRYKDEEVDRYLGRDALTGWSFFPSLLHSHVMTKKEYEEQFLPHKEKFQLEFASPIEVCRIALVPVDKLT